MVTQYGMTERLGAIKLGEANGEPFMGRDFGHTRNYSEDVAAVVDEETKKLLATAHQEAFDILEENRDVLDALVVALLEHETLDKQHVATIFEPLRRRQVRPAWTGSPHREPSAIPPVDVPRSAREDGVEDKQEAGVVITPPSPGGDLHGGTPSPDGGGPPPPPTPGAGQ
jgi:cell division protease FtsH